MSFNINLYKLDKRINSTKRPTGNGTVVSVNLKAPCSIYSPVFVLNGIADDFNYVKWGNRYYFVTDCVRSAESATLVEYTCTLDSLATCKDAINACNAYVEYSASNYNGMIPDKRLSMSETVIPSEAVSTAIATGTTGTYILTTASNDNSAIVGFSSMYAIDAANARKVANWLYDDSVIASVLKAFDSPSQAIIGCHWVPWDLNTGGDLVHIGDEITGTGTGDEAYANGLHVESENLIANTVTVNIPWVDGVGTTGLNWTNYEPYSQFDLYLPFYGTIALDAAKLQGHQSITIDYKFDSINGDVTYRVTCGLFKGTYKTNQAVQLAVGQSQNRKFEGVMQQMGGLVSAGSAGIMMATGLGSPALAAGAAVAGISQVAAGTITGFKDTNTGGGTNGGMGSAGIIIGSSGASKYRCVICTRHTHTISDGQSANNSVLGRPLFANRTLSSLSGYIKCAGASVSTQYPDSITKEVNTFLNSGFYLE